MGATREKKIIVKKLQVQNGWTFTGDVDAQQDVNVGADADITGTLDVGGVSTFADDVSITGNVEITGDTTLTGDLEVTGDATFAALAATVGISLPVAALTETDAIEITSGLVTLAHATTPIEATKAAPAAGDVLYIINTSASGTESHTVTLPEGVTWDGTNRVATLDAPGEALLVIALSATRLYVVVNNGTVAFSNPA